MRWLLLVLLLSGPAAAELTVARPAGEVWIQEGESYLVEVFGPAGKPVRVGGVLLAEGPPGRYTARLALHGRLQVQQGDVSLPFGPVRVLGQRLPVARIIKDNAVFRTAPEDAFDRLDPLPAGLQANVNGRQGDWLRLWPGLGWVHKDDVRLGNFPPSEPELRSVIVREPGDGSAEVRLKLAEPAAWQVRMHSVRHLQLILPGTRLAMGEVAYAQNPRRVRSVQLIAERDRTMVDFHVAPGVWGWKLRWDAPDLVLTLAAPPPRSLRGLRVVLDAGHGGTDNGAVGVGGLKEKDLNLAQTLALKTELEAAGAVVTLTRATDVDVAAPDAPAEQELGARVRIAEEAGGQLFLSLHHNARADLAEARRATGTHLYYYRPQSRRLAEALARPLAEAIGEPDYMALWRSFAVIRQTSMPAVLVESNFLSNPAVEERMRQPDYAPASARGIRRGLERFLRTWDRPD